MYTLYSAQSWSSPSYQVLSCHHMIFYACILCHCLFSTENIDNEELGCEQMKRIEDFRDTRKFSTDNRTLERIRL